MEKIRIQKALSECGIASRRKAEEERLIRKTASINEMTLDPSALSPASESRVISVNS